MFKKFLKSKLQKGQSMIFMAISIPILFAMIGAAADFGWLYLNQSRLQNAADAAAFAGSKKLIFWDESLDDYGYSKLISNYDADLERLVNERVISSRDTSDGDNVAKRYAKLNLSGWLGDENLEIVDIGPARGTFRVNDTTPSKWGTVKFKHLLYGKDEEDYSTLYYTVILTEQLEHFLNIDGLMDHFINMEAKAVAVARISHYKDKKNTDPVGGESLYSQMVALRSKKTFSDWWYIKNEVAAKQTIEDLSAKYNFPISKYKNQNTGVIDTNNMTTFVARQLSVQARGNTYVDSNFYRTETLTLHGYSIAVKDDDNEDTTNNKPSIMDQRNYNSLFVDLKVDRSNSNAKDTDPGSTETGYNSKYNSTTKKYSRLKENDTFSKGLTGKEVFKFRIHDLINVGRWNGSSYEYVYKVRSGKDAPDPLYVKIESEDNYVDGGGGNTVRQMIININAANTDSLHDRPIFLFYDGPQKWYGFKNGNAQKNTRWEEKWRETWKHLVNYENNLGYDDEYITNNPANGSTFSSAKRNLRNSLPVILNFYKNFRGVFFFPNSPVVINGNRKNFEGFVVAQKFLRLKQATDFPEKAENPSGYYYFKDDRDNEYYKNDDDLIYYHKKAEGGTRYIQIITAINSSGEKVIRYRNVVYAKGPVIGSYKNPVDDDITPTDSVYINPNGEYVILSPSTSEILYTYTWMNQEKSNLTKTFENAGDYEKEYVHVNPMYIDEMGNVQYAALKDGYKSELRPTPIQSEHNGYYGFENYNLIDDQNEIVFNPTTFNFNSVRYNGYDQIILANYTKLNDSSRNLYDVFYTTIRSDWIK